MSTKTQVPAVRSELQDKLAKIDARLKEIKHVADSPFQTNGQFRYNPFYTANSAINIHNCTSLDVLLSILGYVTEKFENYEKGAQIAGLKEYPIFKWMNYTYEAWVNDLKTRIVVVSQHEQVNKLRKAKASLETFLTEDDRLASVLASIDI